MKSKKPYAPNDWEAVFHSAFPDNMSYEDVEDYIINNWHLNSSHTFHFRAQHKVTGKIKEYAYQRPHPAQMKLIDLVTDGYEVTVCDHDSISSVSMREPENDE